MRIHWFFKVLIVFISALFIWLCFYFVLPKILAPQHLKDTEVYGLILSDQVWEGDINVTGDIFSPTNNTVTILPGTNIRVAIKDDKSNFDFLPWHKKSGINTGSFERGVDYGKPFWDETEKIQISLNRLVVLGNFSQPVTFRSDSDNPSPYDYNLIKIRSGEVTQAVFSDYRRFEAGDNVLIADSKFRNTGECSLCFYKGNPRVSNSFFEKSLGESIWVERASPQIDNNLFQNLDGEGIKIDSKRLSKPIITNNDFEMPQQTAINFISGGQTEEGLIARNVFAGNTQIKIACDTKLKIRDNVILGSISFSNGCNGGFTFGTNYWGTPEINSIIKEKILDKYDTFQINIPNVLMTAPEEAGRK